MKIGKKAASTVGAFLGSNSEFKGRLTFQGTIRIDGRYEGSITVDGTLVVGPSGRVNAEISASNMIVSGEVTGNLTAETNIEIHASGKVYGNLMAPTVTTASNSSASSRPITFWLTTSPGVKALSCRM